MGLAQKILDLFFQEQQDQFTLYEFGWIWKIAENELVSVFNFLTKKMLLNKLKF